MSKTERALEDDGVALDDLDDFVATEAAAADRAIDELIEDAVDDRVDVDLEPYPGDDLDDGNGANGSDSGELDRIDDEIVEVFETGEIAVPPVDELDLDAPPPNGSDGDTDVRVAEATIEVVDDDVDTGRDADVDGAAGDAVLDPRAVVVEADGEDVDDEAYELPDIVPATSDDPDVEGAEAREGDLDEVSDDVLEELRHADIDGPVVDLAPQDDTTSARRRPKRRPDYDPAPMPIPAKPPRILGRKPRVRKVTRVVRHVDPWSVFKIAAVAFMVMYGVLLTAGVLLWNVAHATGTIDNIERFFESFGWSTFEFNGGEIYHAAWIAGLFVVIGLTGMAVLTATLFNLITDIVGGMRFTVLEEEVVETRTSPMRRFVVRRPEPEVPVEVEDSSGSMIREAVVDDSGAIERGTR